MFGNYKKLHYGQPLNFNVWLTRVKTVSHMAVKYNHSKVNKVHIAFIEGSKLKFWWRI
jgi:hypothetical protein